MKLRPYQTDLIAAIRRAWQSHRRVMAQLPTGGGKCLGKDTLVLMADGRILPVQEIRQGDKIMGDDSQPRTVISVNVGREMLYRITPVKGDSWVCNESHVLSLTSAGTDCGFEKNGIYDMELREYLSLNKTQKHLLKQYRSKVQEFHNNENQLPIEPYFLGVLLGDGSLKRSICVTTPDPEIVAEVDKQARIFGLAVRHEIMEGNKASNYYLINHDGRRNGRNGGTNPIANILKSLGLRNSCYDKFIPFIYKTASWNDRLEVLAGLIDTDGHYGHQFEFSSSSRLLAEDVAFISRSLGLAAYISNKVINLQTYYRVVISGDIDIIPTRISRKRATPRLQIKSVLRTGFTVEPIGIGDYYGFEIDGNRRFLLGDFTVTHNTVIFNSIIQEAQQQGRRCMMIVHRKELITQAGRKLYKMGVDYGVIMAGYDSRYSAPVQLASVQTLIRRSMPKGIDILITDECFPAGTLVDGRAIETIKAGEKVASFNHTTGKTEFRQVVRLFKRQAPDYLYRITFTNGITITCTAGHPIYDITAGRYIPAISLKLTSKVLYANRTEAVPELRHNDNAGNETSEGNAQKGAGVLFGAMHEGLLSQNQFGNDVGNKQTLLLGAHEGKQSDEQAGERCENEAVAEKNRASSADTGREWTRTDRAAEITCGSIELPDRVCGKDRIQRTRGNGIPFVLQGGYSPTGNEIVYRDRRQQPFYAACEIQRPEERGLFEVVGVDNIEILECGNTERFAEMCPDGHVYNIEVEGNHNYFANGVLVHNCHHATAQSYRDIYAEYPNAQFLGVTATPIRTNGEGFADLFDTLVCGATVTELIADGYLVAPQIYASPTALDLAKIKKTGGDYNERALAEAMDNKRLVGGLVEQWTKHCYGRQTVTFAITVEHSKHIVEQYRAAGISAEHIDGTTPQDRRDKIIADFAKGQFKVLSNVGIVTEGFDVPEIEVVQLARPTTSLALYLQMVGRGLRPAAGKGKAIVLDHADCVFEHGFPEQDRKWTLKGIPKREKAETERKVMARDKTGQMFMSNELPAHITDIELVEIDYSQARIKALEKCVAEAKQYSPKPAAGWYRFEKNVLKGTRATEYEIQHFYRISPKWDKKNHFISYKMVEYGHRPTERYPWMDKSKAAIRFPQTAV